MQLTGAQALIKSLEMEGVEVMFGLPGGCILPAYDPILDSSIRHILVRHEQGAGHMAEGYAHVTGRPGVAMVTSGPGGHEPRDAAVRRLHGLDPDGRHHRPGADRGDRHRRLPGVRHRRHHPLGHQAQRAGDGRRGASRASIREAFHIATTGRPGPVLVDVPKDVLQASMDWWWPESVDLPGYKPTTKGHPRMIREAARLILESERPVIYAGGGILKARAADALRELAELTGIHVVTTLMAARRVPRRPPAVPGHAGHARQRHRGHGDAEGRSARSRSGSRFDDRVTGKVAAFAPDAKVIHVDIDPAEQGKVRRPDVPIVGDCRLVIEEIVRNIRALLDNGTVQADIGAWKSRISGWRETFPLTYEPSEPGEALKPQFCLEVLRDSAPEDCIVVSGVGQHQMWASQYWKFRHPYTWVNSGGLGTMGFAVPAAIGAKVGRPDRMVWAVDGDGCFQMTAQELVTASTERIPIKVAILNNAYLGMVRQWQEMFYDERYSEVYLSPDLPDYVKWAEAMGCIGIRVESPEEVQPAIDKANEIDDRPVVVEFRTDSGEKVFPMVPAGQSNDDIVLAAWPGQGDAAMNGSAAAPHPVGARREQVRRAGTRRQPVRPARLQHLLARRGADRGRAVQPHHDRRRRRVGTARADREAAVQAHQRREDQRARPAPRGRARAAARDRAGRGRRSAARSSSSCASSRARSWPSGPTR